MNDLQQRFLNQNIVLHSHGNLEKIIAILEELKIDFEKNIDTAKRSLRVYKEDTCIRLDERHVLHYGSYPFYEDNNFDIYEIDEALGYNDTVVEEEEFADIFK